MSDCKSVQNLGSEIMEKLNEKNKLKRSGSNYSKVKFNHIWYISTSSYLTQCSCESQCSLESLGFSPGTLVFSHWES